MSSRRSNAARTDLTRRAIIHAARDRFITVGYASTTIGEVASASGYTIGALYHHWSGKDALLGSVVENIYSDLGRSIRRKATPAMSPQTRLILAGTEFLRLCSHTQTATLLLIDAPAGLGYERWREIDDGWWLSPTMLLIQDCRESAVRRNSLRQTALCLLGALTYLGRDVSLGPDRNLDEAIRTYDALVRAVVGDQPSGLNST